MRLRPEEPAAGPWRVEPIVDVVTRLLGEAPQPAVIGVDGRSSSGKTTLARRMAEAVAGAGATAVVHSDDIAWHHSIFGWIDLLLEGVVEPVRAGRAVAFRPPAWDARDRRGAVMVPAGTGLLIVEGVGVGRPELAEVLDATVWVQSDLDEIERRNLVRVDAGEISPAGYEQWMAEEVPFLAEQRPWAHADMVVAGTPSLTHDPATEVVVAPPPGRR